MGIFCFSRHSYSAIRHSRNLFHMAKASSWLVCPFGRVPGLYFALFRSRAMSRVWVFVPSIRAFVDPGLIDDGAFVVCRIHRLGRKEDLQDAVSLERSRSFYRNWPEHLVALLEVREPSALRPKRLSCLFHPAIRYCCLVTFALRFAREYASATESLPVSS